MICQSSTDELQHGVYSLALLSADLVRLEGIDDTALQ